MNERERAQQWIEARTTSHYDALAQDEPWPNRLYIEVDEKRFTPLGYLCYLDEPVRELLERGGDPFERAWKKGKRYRNAYQVCAHEHAGMSFYHLMSVTPAPMLHNLVITNSGACSCRSYFESALLRVVERAARYAIAWALCQTQRDDLIEPVIQRLAAIPLEDWTTPAPNRRRASKRLKASSSKYYIIFFSCRWLPRNAQVKWNVLQRLGLCAPGRRRMTTIRTPKSLFGWAP